MAREDEPIVTIAQRLRHYRVGCVVVTRGRRPVGILTDRDIALRVVAEGRDPATTRAGDVVTYDPIVVSVDDGLEKVTGLMRDHGIRRIPIVDAEGALVGIITADELVVRLGDELANVGRGLAESADAEDSR